MFNGLPPGIEWRLETEPVAYRHALDAMTERNAAIAAGEAEELVWLLEHPPLYTAGTSARPADLTDPDRLQEFHAQAKSMGFACGDLTQRGEIQKLLNRVRGQAGEAEQG